MTEEETDTTEIEVEQVSDPEEYIQERRLKDIYDAKKRVRERRLKAKELQLKNEYHDHESLDAVRMYRTAVENYLTELRPLFLDDEKGIGYWYELDMGEMIIQPPERDDYRTKLEPKSVELTGMNCLFDIPEPIVAEWEVTVSVNNLAGGGTSKKKVRTKASLNFSQLDMIVQNANYFLAEKGFELDPQDNTEPASI